MCLNCCTFKVLGEHLAGKSQISPTIVTVRCGREAELTTHTDNLTLVIVLHCYWFSNVFFIREEENSMP